MDFPAEPEFHYWGLSSSKMQLWENELTCTPKLLRTWWLGYMGLTRAESQLERCIISYVSILITTKNKYIQCIHPSQDPIRLILNFILIWSTGKPPSRLVSFNKCCTKFKCLLLDTPDFSKCHKFLMEIV